MQKKVLLSANEDFEDWTPERFLIFEITKCVA